MSIPSASLSMPATNNARILAQGVTQSNDTRATGMNNNDLIIGPTGAGKTRGYVIPNLVHNSGESMVIVDTKGNLRKVYGEYLMQQGYEVLDVDFVDCLNSEHGYDPLRLVGFDNRTKRYAQQDVLRISAALCPVSVLAREPYWEQAAQMLLASLIALTLERFSERERNMKTVCYLAERAGSGWVKGLFDELAISDPDSFAVHEHRLSTINSAADKMTASVVGILANALHPLSFDGAKHLFEQGMQVDFANLGHKKTALFVTVSDSDRSLDRLVNVFYTQLLQELIREADRQSESALPIPVRIILDDFATNTVIPDFDKTITTIRSRGIAVSLIVQDLSQLDALYGPFVGTIIANNCDTWLYLGGQDVSTAERLSVRLDKTPSTILSLGIGEAILMRRGRKPECVTKFALSDDAIHEAIMEERSKVLVMNQEASEVESLAA